jgi:hypothetical protein
MQRGAARDNGVGKNCRHEIGSLLRGAWRVGSRVGWEVDRAWTHEGSMRRPGKHSRVLMDSLDSPYLISDR